MSTPYNMMAKRYGVVEDEMDYASVPQMQQYIHPPPPYSLDPKAMSQQIPQQIPYQRMNYEKKPKKRRNDQRSDHREELLKELAEEIYIRWKVKKMKEKHEKEMKDKLMEEKLEFDELKAEKKAEKRWRKETADTTRLFYKAAMLENTMLGDDEMLFRKKKKEAKIKEDCHPYLLFCKEHREQLGNKYNGKEVLTLLSDRWKKLDQTERNKYIDMAKKNKMIQNQMIEDDQMDAPQPPPMEHTLYYQPGGGYV